MPRRVKKKKPAQKAPYRPTKGKKIKFVGGQYMGNIGFIDCDPLRNQELDDQIYVIVCFERGEEYPTRVCKENVLDFKAPEMFIEHALDQHPSVAACMKELCKALASFDLDTDKKFNDTTHLFARQLQKEVARVNKGGSRIRLRKVKGERKKTIH